jgi:hypothetical protein
MFLIYFWTIYILVFYCVAFFKIKWIGRWFLPAVLIYHPYMILTFFRTFLYPDQFIIFTTVYVAYQAICSLDRYPEHVPTDDFLRYYSECHDADFRQVRLNEPPDVKTAIYSIHPHGILSKGFIAFAHDKIGNKLVRPAIHNVIFYLPFFREVSILNGYIPCTKERISQTLQKGYSVAILPGGIKELPIAPNNNDIIFIKNRKGIFEIAHQEQVPIVPVVVYGENELYYNLSFPFFGVKFPLMVGRFPLYWRPFDVELKYAFGKPIVGSNSSEDLRSKYVEEIKEIDKKYGNGKLILC